MGTLLTQNPGHYLRLCAWHATSAPPPRFWMNMQVSYELEVTEDQLRKALMREVLPRTAA
ncbi:MAG TPA: hypothetical protein VMH20_13785 [Verrucomicrobiae bacterium]|nr:hypothetical protein [Verrucomicrobiae bacterium]